MLNWHAADALNRMYCNLKDGKKIGMPRYFKQKIYSDEQRKIIGQATRQKMEQITPRQEKLTIERHIALLKTTGDNLAARLGTKDRF